MIETPIKLTVRQRRLRYAARKASVVMMLAAIVAAMVFADRFGLFGRAPTPDKQKYHDKVFRVVHVVDGDTLDVDIPDGQYDRTRIRLWGVDTPETLKKQVAVQHFGPEASEFAKTAVLDKMVTLKLEPRRTRDNYGRLLAYVYLPDGQMLNRVLIEKGYGYADPRFDHRHKSEFRRLQRRAKRLRLGLWKNATDADLPYYYRGKLKLTESPEANTTTGGASKPVDSPRAAA